MSVAPDSRFATVAGEIAAPTLIQRLATADLLTGPGRRHLERAAIATLVVMAILATWIAADGFQARPHRASDLAGIMKPAPVEVPLDTAAPKVEPVDYVAISADVARSVNAGTPVAKGPLIPARPFLYSGTSLERERAQTCLAMAAYYEAGDDSAGQSAVVQVVLNRVRHPAFPKSICGVVLQGADRATGCQFTFTCDGSLARRVPAPEALMRARSAAAYGLSGGVFRIVGNATHYHTDYVLPSWSLEMDKLAAFHGHLFFRWRGIWGRPDAFRGRYAGPETLDRRFERFAEAPAVAPPVINSGLTLPADPSSPSVPLSVARMPEGVIRADENRHLYYVHLAGDAYPGSYAVAAFKICAGKSPCTVFGWKNVAEIPAAVSPDRPNTLTFSFQKGENGSQLSLWNCRQVLRSNRSQCLPGTASTETAAVAPPALAVP